MKTRGNAHPTAPEFNRKDSLGLGIISGGITTIINQNSEYLGHQIKVLFPNSPIELIQKKDALSVFLMASAPVIIFDRVHHYCMAYFEGKSTDGKVAFYRSFFAKVLTSGMAGAASVGLGYIYQEDSKTSLSISVTGFLIYYAIKSLISLRKSAENSQAQQPQSLATPIQTGQPQATQKLTNSKRRNTFPSSSPDKRSKTHNESSGDNTPDKSHLALFIQDHGSPQIATPMQEPLSTSPGSNPPTPSKRGHPQLAPITTTGLSAGAAGHTPKSASAQQRSAPIPYPTVVLSPNKEHKTVISTHETPKRNLRERATPSNNGSPSIKPINPSPTTTPQSQAPIANPSPLRRTPPPLNLSLNPSAHSPLPPRAPSASLNQQHTRKPSRGTPPQTPNLSLQIKGRTSPSLGDPAAPAAPGKTSPPSATSSSSSSSSALPITSAPDDEPVKYGRLTPQTTPITNVQPVYQFEKTYIKVLSPAPTPHSTPISTIPTDPLNQSIFGTNTPLYASPAKPADITPTPSTPSSEDIELRQIPESKVNSQLSSSPTLTPINESPISQASDTTISKAGLAPLSPLASTVVDSEASTSSSSASSAVSSSSSSTASSAASTSSKSTTSSATSAPKTSIISPETEKASDAVSPSGNNKKNKKKNKKDKQDKKDKKPGRFSGISNAFKNFGNRRNKGVNASDSP